MAPKGAKKARRVKKIKLHPREEMEKIKVWSAMLAEITAVQTELLEEMDPDSSSEDQRMKVEQLKGVNIQCELLDSMIQNYFHVMLGGSDA